MTDTAPGRNGPSEFLSKLLTVWREGYGLAQLRADAALDAQPGGESV